MPEKYSPSLYAKILDEIEVRNISFLNITANSFPINFGGEIKLGVEAQNKVEFQTDAKTNNFAGIDRYQITGKYGEKKVFEIEVAVIVYFNSSIKVDQDFLKLFEMNSLKIFTYPHIRQIVQDLTMRMGLAPLILPIWKVHRKSKTQIIKKEKAAKETVNDSI